MKKSINNYDFHRAFETLRPDNFSYDGLNSLFDYFEQYQDDTGEQVELDVIAICCDFSESTYDEIYADYIAQKRKAFIKLEGNNTLIANKIDVYNQSVYDDIQENPDDKHDIMESWLASNTSVVSVNDDTVIYQQF